MSTIGEIPIDLHITPIDGRNYHKIKILSNYFSERAINSKRVFVELEYLLWLSKHHVIRPITKKELAIISSLTPLSSSDYQKIRAIEKEVNHDMKAVEINVQKQLAKTTLQDVVPMVHIGLTSEDVNACAYALCINESMTDVFFPIITSISEILVKSARAYKSIPLLARTHGQPANGTTLGKEVGVYAYRLKKLVRVLSKKQIGGKLSGNVGNFNAHHIAFPSISWISFSKTFLSHLGIPQEPMTTQIVSYDSYIELFQTLFHINSLFLGLCKDLWTYMLLGLVRQKNISREVGSTALPHKINPIYLEGAEGGFEIANSMLEGYIRKLSYSRLQRDLSDSTIRRSFGIMFSYCLLSYQSVIEALNRIEPHEEKMKQELLSHWEILSEAIQTLLRANGSIDAYEQTKKFFRGEEPTQADVEQFIKTLPLPPIHKNRLLSLSPDTYTGLSKKLVETYVK